MSPSAAAKGGGITKRGRGLLRIFTASGGGLLFLVIHVAVLLLESTKLARGFLIPSAGHQLAFTQQHITTSRGILTSSSTTAETANAASQGNRSPSGQKRKRTRTTGRDTKQPKDENAPTIVSSSCSSASVSLEYSPNFQRHIVRDGNGTVMESFLWLDEALEKYPAAALRPIQAYQRHRYQQCLFSSDQNTTGAAAVDAASCGSEEDDVLIFVAGGGLNETSAYPVVNLAVSAETGEVLEHNAEIDDPESASAPSPPPPLTNLERISHCLESILFWYPGQVEKLMEIWPPLRSYPADLLEERLRFLLAPLPDDDDNNILQKVNVTEDIDWPRLFLRDGRGAGMSVAQVSHALLTLPEPFLLRLNYDAYLRQDPECQQEHGIEAVQQQQQQEQPLSRMKMSNPNYGRMVADMYERTPSVVIQMTQSVLDLWVTGVSNLDVIALSFLHWQGWDWQDCRIVLHAFPSCQQCNLEPSWVVLEGSQSFRNSRKRYMAASLSYLQIRLHLRPWHLFAMLKTHSRLSTYSASNLKRTLDFLQDRLRLRSKDLRKLILLMPSLLGASLEALDSRIVFWLERVGLTVDQLQNLVTQKPALLQYSVINNLQPKLEFFIGELDLDPITLRKMTLAVPELWCRSHERFLAPSKATFCLECGDLTSADFGQIIARVPQLLRYSTIGLQTKLQFLKDRLGLTALELKRLIQSSPRVLLQSISTNLEPKINLLESVIGGSCRNILQANPSLLNSSLSKMKDSLKRADIDQPELISDRLALLGNGRRSRKEVWMLSENREAEKKFSCVAEAARHAATSQANMYSVIREGRPLKGRKYIYAKNDTSPADGFLDYLFQLKDLQQEGTNEDSVNTTCLVIHTAGSAFPPEDTVRGRRRAGGMALQIQSWSPDTWRTTCVDIWKGRRLRLLPDGQTVILEYNYLRPSRPRCSLYACEEALRVATQWKKKTPSNASLTVNILTDSSYVFDLLQNTSKVFEWGRHEQKGLFLSEWADATQPCDLYRANPDILYPLSRSYYHLVERNRSEGMREVSVQFLHGNLDENARRLRDAARFAAKLMHHTIR